MVVKSAIARSAAAVTAALLLFAPGPALAEAGCTAPATPPAASGGTWEQRRAELLLRAAPHGFGGSALWRLGPRGVELCRGTVAADAEVRYRLRYLAPVWKRHGGAIAAAAKRHGVPAELILTALIEESGGRAEIVVRYPGYVSDAETPHKISVGLGQMLLSTAQRMAPGTGVDRAYVQNPANAIDLVARFFAFTYRTTGFDPPLAASVYNAGGLRAAPGADNRWKVANGRYVERFVAVFNASVAHLALQPDRPAESFAAIFGGSKRD